ncbi:MAG: class II aldolase/adducin family protein [Actinomyces sp.]|jgi:L-fuculose-phosphate aldolase|nr:class II aldolase/adducin family protein [Actinomyces sp.]MCI1788362.1 class II aldolase/adducin family protein [Actinomyces sp.]MCI1831181.1 class II aldolase/adducin family protein [Actinomyces sp.]
MLLEEQRRTVVETCLAMQKAGLVVGTAGNVSARDGDMVVISPSAVPYEEMRPEDVCVIDMDGTIIEGEYKPSSEMPLHLSVYRSTDARGITHNHAPASTAMGLVVDTVPTSHYYSAMFGGPVRVAPYAPFGSLDLARNVTDALRDRHAALMANHGAITTGASLEAAASLLPYLEYICEIELRAMSTRRQEKILSEDQIQAAVEAMTSYRKTPRA